MKTLILFIFFTGSLCSCNSALDKTVFEPLTVEELKKSIDSDSAFESTYKAIQFIKDSVLKSDLERAKFADLSYRRLHDLNRFSRDSTHFKPIREELRKEWADKYGVLHSKVDSISNYWKKYRNENSLDQYVKVELVQIEKEYYSYSNNIRNVNLGFKLTPLKGQVDQLRFGYKIEAKINESKEESLYESIYSSLDKSWCLATTPFAKPIIRFWEVNYSNEKILQQKTLEAFFRDYNIYIEIDEIRKDGKNMSNDDLQIPESIKHHWRYEKEEYLKDIYVKDILKDVLNLDYVPQYEYMWEGIKKELKEKDDLAFEFLNITTK